MKKSSVHLGTKGQLTILLIIAAVLIIGAGAAWYLIGLSDGPEVDTQGDVDQNQIERFVESCLQASAEDVFTRIGEQAGYTNPVRDGIPSVPGASTEGPALQPFSGVTTPYWSYMSSPNDCTQCLHATQQPPLEGAAFPAIQYQAAREIEVATLTCLNDFKDFEGQYIITPQAEPIATVSFGEQDTQITFTYPLSIERAGDKTTSLSEFQATLDIPFRKLYTVANDIRTQSDATGYFELRTLEEITLASALDGKAIPPPQGGLEIGYDPGPFWTVLAVEPIIRESLETGTLMVQLFGSRGADFISTGDPAKDNLYLQYYLFTDTTTDYSDIQANFLYFADWSSYLDVHPSKGQLIKPELVSSGIPFIPNIKRMDFQYDVSYPVLVQLRAPTKAGEYLLQFPLEVNLRRNNPNTFTPVLPVPEIQDLCDPGTVSGPPVTITTSDQDGAPLASNVRFECINAACPIGETQGGIIRTQLPACLQGVIIAEREGYVTAEETIDATGDDPIAVDVTLNKLSTVQVELKGIELVKTLVGMKEEWTVGGDVAITNKQTAIVEIEPQGTGDTQFIVIPAQDEGRTTVDLAPGQYAVRVFIIENLDKPKLLKGEKICEGGFIGIGEKCETIPDVTIGEPSVTDPETGETYDTNSTSIPVGGLTWDDTTKFIDISANDLAAGKIQLPVVIINTASLTKVLDLRVYEQVEAFSQDLTLIPVPLEE